MAMASLQVDSTFQIVDVTYSECEDKFPARHCETKAVQKKNRNIYNVKYKVS